jgi:hypothetical protein
MYPLSSLVYIQPLVWSAADEAWLSVGQIPSLLITSGLLPFPGPLAAPISQPRHLDSSAANPGHHYHVSSGKGPVLH